MAFSGKVKAFGVCPVVSGVLRWQVSEWQRHTPKAFYCEYRPPQPKAFDRACQARRGRNL